MSRTEIVRVTFDDKITVAAVQVGDAWVIALSDRIEEDSAEEHLALSAARRSIGLWLLGFRQPEAGVDCQVSHLAGVDGPRVAQVPAQWRRARWLESGVAAAALTPLTALADHANHFSTMLSTGAVL